MSQVNILIAVNVAQAINTGRLGDYVYMVDDSLTGKSSGEGGDELSTVCENGDTVVWRVESIDPDQDVSINRFDGDIIATGMVNPAPYPQTDSDTWGGRINSVGTQVEYRMYLTLNKNTVQSFDPFITATNPER
ncbi:MULTISPECIES: hypothetical protein [Paraburkholderia]|uniref:Inclusion body protein n=1 Tax=Paraburkholderia nemoris TaxID=2793076 RepID=A0ABN7NAP3_9BURK|nr:MULTISPECIES: hypothetical protein [Paraburkholderia]KPD14615.1 hypothetical protein ADM96_38535 [Burkholderia sp. ST111]MBK5151814.1 hypothetical protein [Burkholderia sp. R-69608]MBK5183246.1 hypothetical protein [Burkholderia sp. R-69749]MBK3743945.1 hypothetical protein [Paraburkholderia aspalathi]MBK3815871.1 hypothetical protein [Paraburkholderia aspalathi]